VLDAKGKPVLDETGEPKMKATRSQHGIRKGVAEIMAELAATEYEPMSSFGWTETKTAGVYTRSFRRRGAAAAASMRLSGGAEFAQTDHGPKIAVQFRSQAPRKSRKNPRHGSP